MIGTRGPVRGGGVGGVPVDAAGVDLQVTGTRPTTPTYLSVTPAGGNDTSNLDLVGGQTASNLAVVPVDPNGDIHLSNHDGSTNVAVDVVGYLT